MNNYINIEEFLKKAESIPVADVRSPSEFFKGHIPGAVNIPLFNDEERAIVGTKYIQVNKDTAIKAALDITGPKLTQYIKQAENITKDKKLLIHCWRGGQRSSGMSWLLNTAGFEVLILTGGYKSYRRYIKQEFTRDIKLIILGGLTGSGKTEILHSIAKLGQQVIDLEQLAKHKGSAFGAFGQKKQPTTEQFENNLYDKWKNLNYTRPLWLEDESKSIGSVWIPDELYSRIRNSQVIIIEIENHQRIKRLVEEYSIYEKKLLENAVLKIRKRIGGLNTKKAIESLENNDYSVVAEIVLQYYDKTYQYGLSKRDNNNLHFVKISGTDKINDAKQILKLATKLNLVTV